VDLASQNIGKCGHLHREFLTMKKCMLNMETFHSFIKEYDELIGDNYQKV
jgi:hypothetical protein